MRLRHGRVELLLHTLKEAGGDQQGAPVAPLLMLHELGRSSEDWSRREEWRLGWSAWPGSVHALDLAGHGGSGHVIGGAYSPEYFLADADLGLAALGDRAVLVGAGLGAWVALLLAGARAERVAAALLWPGHGLTGGGSLPDLEAGPQDAAGFEERTSRAARRYAPRTDPRVCHCESDLRPVDYARSFAERARRLLLAKAPGAGEALPDWWLTTLAVTGVEEAPSEPQAALARLWLHCG
jgi:pimeloyl-ACP methyl ester carboxylesterase